MLGAVLFTVYVSTIGCLIESFGIGYHRYADDTQLYTALKGDMGPHLEKLSQCTTALQHWFWINSLRLNPDKSDVAFYGTRPSLKRVDPSTSVTAAGCAISISDIPKTLRVTLDTTLSFDEHIATVVKACNYHLRALRHIRRCITQDIESTIACSIVGSRIDYCNGLLFGACG